MSFNFGFDVEEGVDSIAGPTSSSSKAAQDAPSQASSAAPRPPGRRYRLKEMLDGLPERISYSTISIPQLNSQSSSNTAEASPLQLPRRDLFDARFQILSEDVDETSTGSVQVNSESDLVPGVYEGGLKTWECSLDLVGILTTYKSNQHHDRVVELGCGTALPTVCYLLRLLLQDEDKEGATKPVQLHLCDFNETVLNLVTLPNLLLAYAFAQAVKEQKPFATTGDVDLTPEFLSEFETALRRRSVEIFFHSGPWEKLSLDDDSSWEMKSNAKTLVLTSETTYSLSGIESLLDVIKSLTEASTASGGEVTSLIATKEYYFGLGGGVVAFLNALQEDAVKDGSVKWSEVETLCQWEKGVRRRVLSVASKA